ncbi:hypothetical protein BGX28_000256 [Mortierella sp. GBA30]|nr:hypothetical protein BGX28_000256 [Mortierella sp. GBA30]
MTSMIRTDDLATLHEQLAQLAQQLALFQTHNTRDADPQIEDQRPSTIFYPSDTEARRYPPIRPSDPLSFFKHDVSDARIREQFLVYPENHAMGYELPKIPSIIQTSKSDKAHDIQLRTIEKRITHLTRPLAAPAGRITTMRVDNLRTSQGATSKRDPLDLVDPKQFSGGSQLSQALSNAFKPRQPNPGSLIKLNNGVRCRPTLSGPVQCRPPQ